MLVELRIQHFALLEKIELSFYPGESVVTGETGSGKSLFVDALDFLRGARSERRILHEARPAIVEAVFIPAPEEICEGSPLRECLEALGIPYEDGNIIVRREFSAKGSKQRLNDISVTLQSLRTVMALLLDIHAQNAQNLLKSPSTYLPLLDAYVGKDAIPLKECLKKDLVSREKVAAKLQALALSPEEVLRETDLLHYQIQEIEDAHLEDLNEEALEQEYKSLVSATERMRMAARLSEALEGDRGLRDGLLRCAQAFDELAGNDASASDMRDMMWQIEAETDTLRSDLSRYRNGIVIDPMRIQEIDTIFQMLQNLRRKYGQNFSEILAFRDTAEKRLALLQGIEAEREKLRQEDRSLEVSLEKNAAALHDLRRNAAHKLEDRVKSEMLEMAIKSMSFSIPFTKTESIGRNGYDRIDFRISTNPGEPMQSLSEVASGGEMSRFMLAMKIIASEISAMPTLIFDEIDTGISGRTAQVVAEKISRLTEHHQVIVITHLPQIAALADTHYEVVKETHGASTITVMHELDEAGRAAEQARLIGGVHITETTRSSAEEMIEQAKRWRMQRKGRS